MPATIARAVPRIELAGGEVVEEEERLGALHDQVVDAHGDEVDADRVEDAGVDGDLELGADAVGGGDQDRVAEARRLQVEQAAEAADLGVGAGPAGRAHQRLDRLDQRVAGVDIDAGIGVGDGPERPARLVGHGCLVEFGRLLARRIQQTTAARNARPATARQHPRAAWLWAPGVPFLVRIGGPAAPPWARPVAETGRPLTLPNLITIARLLLVPLIIWLIVADQPRPGVLRSS